MSIKKVKLISDFHDFYDYRFAGSWEENCYVLDRRSHTDMGKEEQFRIMHSMGLNIPVVGRIKDIPLHPDDKIVHYWSPTSHRGEGKTLTTLAEARKNNIPTSFASQYITGSISESERMLQIGDFVWWIKYSSDHEWKSNCGNKIRITPRKATPELSTLNPELTKDWPIFAIDFVNGFAVDFNTAPHLLRF